MASNTQNVVRYTAILAGVIYGFSHAGTLQAKHNEESAQHATARRAELIEEAKKAWVEKQAAAKSSSGLVTDPEDPAFDLEKVVASWESK
ncbi:uncharacterized protein EHS24_000541 [Apiotrichum porosum]|uniref:ATP synthase F(0) complex subunit e, mitochondrial n=1 Tax=Apiotrichum porosum TaxID=105984 RepID=A0A427YAN8_9TREE|nr:uncharacterized protein EHS24_000541 [Apiotrichum porosum]RSH88017.1 hypothetical protein EHS24_000541 [Apiotrichum porosum]